MTYNNAQLADAPTRNEPPTKRRRIGLACNACRTRKSRCDGQRPTCSACQSLDFECHYEPSDSSTNVIVRKEYLSDLVNRLTSVERNLQRHDDLLKGHLSACTSNGAVHSMRPLSAETVSANTNGLEEHDLHAPALEDPPNEEGRTDGLAMIFVEESTSSYFGESSNIHFTRLLLRAISTVRNTRPAMKAVAEKEYTLLVEKKMAAFSQETTPSVENACTESQASLKTLPSTEDMEEMLDIYFHSTGLLFPFIDEVTMRKTYRECIISGLPRVRRTWLGTLNMIFAMASLSGEMHSTSAKTSLEKSNVFYYRAMGLCGELSKHVNSLEIVHYLLLEVLYCQGSQRSVQAWNSHGLLVRSAMALGLHAHRSDDKADTADMIRQESGHRTWLTIYCLDKVLSMTFGRPAAIPEEFMVPRFPAPWPHSTTSTTLNNSDDLPREFLGVSVRLYQIMGQSLAKQYGANVGRNVEETDEMAGFQALGELRRLLRNWVSNLPPHLQICPLGAREIFETSRANKLRVILTLKYYNINILIHRPLLSSTLQYLFGGHASASRSPPYHVQLAMGETQECVRAAELTIDMVHSILNADRTANNNLGVWFFTLYYVFTAAVIVSARLLWAQHGKPDTDNVAVAHHQDSLRKVDDIFRGLDHGNDLVVNCARYIQYLSQLCDARAFNGSSAIQNPTVSSSITTLACPGSEEPNSGVPPNENNGNFIGLNADASDLFPTEFLDPSVFDGFTANAGDNGFATAFLSG